MATINPQRIGNPQRGKVTISFLVGAIITFFLIELVITLHQDLPDLHPEHIPFYLHNNPEDDAKFRGDYSSSNSTCWGYEATCDTNSFIKHVSCPGSSQGWSKSKLEQKRTFYESADFGYITQRKKELFPFCKRNINLPSSTPSSHLECTSHLRYCSGSNIWIDFTNLSSIPDPVRYRSDILQDGQIGGSSCTKTFTRDPYEHRSPLQSWVEELEHFTPSNELPNGQDVIIIEKHTIILKLDAPVNMYHHFCDFVNLYLTLHMENMIGKRDINLLIFDNIPYRSVFSPIFDAFTSNPLMTLKPFTGKRVIFKSVTFGFLPRMIFGLFYNMPLIPGCSGTRLFQAFNRHIRHSLKLDANSTHPKDSTVRVTFLTRSTKFRRVLNQEELVTALGKKMEKDGSIQVVDFNVQVPFKDQLRIISSTDVLVGIHGAGLTHLLMLPDEGSIIELYNCGDENCYRDLARLRGLQYLTWTNQGKVFPEDEGNHPTLGAHEKFTNYRFDPDEFVHLVMKGVKHVRKKRKLKEKEPSAKDEL